MKSNTHVIRERRKQILEQEQKLKARMCKVKHKIAVISGKDGVGKSAVTVNLTAAFARCNQSFFALLGMDLTFK